jgi:rhodanese-related sulfurtransferase
MTHHHSPGFLMLVRDAKSRVQELSLEEYRRRTQAREEFLLIDVREDHEWARGHLPGAVHLGKGIVERDVENRVPDKRTPIVCYCGGGYRSALVADSLQKMGYTNVRSLDGGYRGWLDAGLPVVKD